MQLLDWAMSVLKFHAERKSVLEVCSFCGFIPDFFQGLMPKAGHKRKGFNNLIKPKVIDSELNSTNV